MSTQLVIGLVVGGAVIITLVIALILIVRRPAPTSRPCGGCGRAMRAEWPRCLFCGWSDPGATPRLEFICGPLAGQSLDLIEDVTTIGSVAGNTVVLTDPAVSRKHVGIRRTGAEFEFADLGSTNGVYINGQRVSRKQLAPGDILRVGTTEIVFRRD